MVVSYGECLKNHAATVGGHALDGCGEFMPSRAATPSDPISLNCAACGCHRNFHRREPDDPYSKINRRYQTYRLCPSLPAPLPRSPSSSPSFSTSPSSPIPLPISHIPPPPFHFSAPHMLVTLSTGFSGAPPDEARADFSPRFKISKTETNPREKKRKRTKFSRDQKEKMWLFSEKLGWKMRKDDEGLVQEFCNEIGIGKRVLKVWMHNNKYIVGKAGRCRASQSCNNGGNDSNVST